MLKLRLAGLFKSARATRLHIWHARRFATGSSPSEDTDVKVARDWLRRFNAETIPRNIGEVSFSRSSGPGGQNVNKVNSKATLQVPFEKIKKHLPPLLIAPLRASRLYKANSDALLIQSDDSRKQADNVNDAFKKLSDMIAEIAAQVVPGETSDAQRQRVQKLAKADNESRLRMKKTHSSKKAARKGGRGGSSDY